MPKQVQCKRCFHLYNDYCIPKLDSPDPDIVRDCQYYIATTNGDRIRRMTNEELADWFSKIQNDIADYYDSDHTFAPELPTLKDSWINWLNKECE